VQGVGRVPQPENHIFMIGVAGLRLCVCGC
jgi:hypothetical protein